MAGSQIVSLRRWLSWLCLWPYISSGGHNQIYTIMVEKTDWFMTGQFLFAGQGFALT
jgi:hypothetical protein